MTDPLALTEERWQERMELATLDLLCEIRREAWVEQQDAKEERA